MLADEGAVDHGWLQALGNESAEILDYAAIMSNINQLADKGDSDSDAGTDSDCGETPDGLLEPTSGDAHPQIPLSTTHGSRNS